ncbi:MAG: CcdB family protein [Rhizomicrobium sp.]
MSLQQYDVIPANAPYSFYVVLQSDLMQDLATRIVAPLVDATKLDPLDTLWPKVALNSLTYAVLIPLMQSIRPDANVHAVANLVSSAGAIENAIDLVFTVPD